MYNTVVRLCQFFLFGGKANLVRLTLFYSIPLLALKDGANLVLLTLFYSTLLALTDMYLEYHTVVVLC